MLNIEKYKDKIIKARGVSCFCISEGKICSCFSIPCSKCEFYDHDECYVNKTNWLCSEYKEPEIDWDNDIDWMKVPVDTDVLVKDGKDSSFHPRKFAIYVPERYVKYYTFDNEEEHKNSSIVRDWVYCRLVNPEDIEKYRKR